MPSHPSIPLAPFPIYPGDATYQAILGWPFPSQPFYEAQVLRVLRNDIPTQIQYGNGMLWGYRDPAGNTVAFGSLDVCADYIQFTNGKLHTYLPVLGVNPSHRGQGHGPAVVDHLIAAAAAIVLLNANLSDRLFLDVYTANQLAITLYEQKRGFTILNPKSPELDQQENNEPYLIMAKSVAVAAGGAAPAAGTCP